MAIDLSELTQALGAIKRATVAQLGDLVDRALAMESLAVTTGSQLGLPGDATRAQLLSKLQAHKAVLDGTADQGAMVVDPALSVVRSDVIAAAVDLNSVVEGANYQLDVAREMLTDMTDAAQAIAGAVGGAAAGAVGQVLDVVKWVGIGLAVVGGAVALYFVVEAVTHKAPGKAAPAGEAVA